MSIEGHANVLLFHFFALQAAPLVHMYMYYCTNYGCVSCKNTQCIQLVSLWNLVHRFFPLLSNERNY